MSRRRLAGVVMACLALAQPLQAQVLGTGILPVTEVGANLYQNTVTAVQSVLTAIAAAETAANTLLDLTPLDEVITLQGILEDVKLLADIVAQAEGLSNDVASLRAQIAALFDLETAPASTSALQERLAEIRRVRGAVLQLCDAPANVDDHRDPHDRPPDGTPDLGEHVPGREAGDADPRPGQYDDQQDADHPDDPNRGLSTGRECG